MRQGRVMLLELIELAFKCVGFITVGSQKYSHDIGVRCQTSKINANSNFDSLLTQIYGIISKKYD